MKWYSTHKNDQWVAEVYDYKHDGSFVEIGACSGSRLSSCYVLEKDLDWYGVAVEPNSKYYKECRVNRKNPLNACIYNYDGEVDYVECEGRIEERDWAAEGLSGIKTHLRKHHEHYHKKYGKMVKKKCVSPSTLLKEYNYPKTIDYLSLDTEGSEFEILRAWPWEHYRVGLLSVEVGDEVNELSTFLKTKNYYKVKNPFCPEDYEAHYCHEYLLPKYKFEIIDE